MDRPLTAYLVLLQDQRDDVIQKIASTMATYICDAYEPARHQFKQQVFNMRIVGNEQFLLTIVIGSGKAVASNRVFEWPIQVGRFTRIRSLSSSTFPDMEYIVTSSAKSCKIRYLFILNPIGLI